MQYLVSVPNVSCPSPPILCELSPPGCPCVIAQPPPDPTPRVPYTTSPVPTLSEWALIALGLMLAVAGAKRLR